jgi:hypothetical protein
MEGAIVIYTLRNRTVKWCPTSKLRRAKRFNRYKPYHKENEKTSPVTPSSNDENRGIKKSDSSSEERETTTKCTVCYKEISTEDETTILSCSHVFHRICINHWALTRVLATCPLCRTNYIQLNELNLQCLYLNEDEEEARISRRILELCN